MARHDLRDDQDFSPGALVAAGVGKVAGVAMETMTEDQRRLNEMALSVAAQASGFADQVKKHVFHGHPLNRDAALTTLSELSAAATDALQFVWLMEADDAVR